MYWKRQTIIEENLLLEILKKVTISEDNILKRCQTITSCNYCNYIHKSGKNKGFICGTVSKKKDGRCYTHSRTKKIFNNKENIKKEKNNKNKKIIFEINIYLVIIFSVLYKSKKYISYTNHYINQYPELLFVKKYLFIVQKETYNVLIKLYDNYKTQQNTTFSNIKNVENCQQNLKYSEKSLKNKKKKNKKRIKKVLNVKNDINLNDLKNNTELTLTLLDEKACKVELAYTLHLLFKENIKLFKVYLNIILSNIDIFFNNTDMEILSKIWKNNIEHVLYKRVLIFSDNNLNDIIEKIFSYVKGNHNLVHDYVKVLWIDFYKNSVVPYNKKYHIDFYKSGINIYDNKDVKKKTPLPLNKLTILYY